MVSAEEKFGQIQLYKPRPDPVKTELNLIQNKTEFQFKKSKSDSFTYRFFSDIPSFIDFIQNKNITSKTSISIFNQFMSLKINDELIYRVASIQNKDGGFPLFKGMESNEKTSLYFLRMIYQLKKERHKIINNQTVQLMCNDALNYFYNRIFTGTISEVSLSDLFLIRSEFLGLKIDEDLNRSIKEKAEQFINSLQINYRDKLIQTILLNKQFKRSEAITKFTELMKTVPESITIQDITLLLEAASDLSKFDQKIYNLIQSKFIQNKIIQSENEFINLQIIKNQLSKFRSSKNKITLNIDNKLMTKKTDFFEITVSKNQTISITELDKPFLLQDIVFVNEISYPKIQHTFYKQRLTSISGIQLEKIADKQIQQNDIVVAEIAIQKDSTELDIVINDFYPIGFDVLSTVPELVETENGSYYQFHDRNRMVFHILSIKGKKMVIQYPLKAILKGDFQRGYTETKTKNANFYNSYLDRIIVN